MFATIVDEVTGENSYLYACTPACAVVDWEQGPGDLRSPDKAFPDALARNATSTAPVEPA
jgi:hypothetical protein